MALRDTPANRDELLQQLESARSHDVPWKSGRAFGYVFETGDDAQALGKTAYASFLTENGLDPTAFPSYPRLENDVIGWVLDQTRCPAEGVGIFTSGGTESILLAVKAAREAARAARPDLARFELVLPITAHAAFFKAAHYFDLDVVTTAVDPESFRADPGAIEAAITERTAMVVVSAPSFAHGVVDPVAEVAAVCRARGVWLHTDGCVGGWLLPYFRALGAKVPDYDFSVEGVQSMSVDLHKFAFCAKGASVVLFRAPALRRHAAFACGSWTGYSLVNFGVQSSKSEGPVASAWATLQAFGHQGYRAQVEGMHRAAERVRAAVRAHPDLRVLGEPCMSLFAIASDTVNVFHLQDELRLRGWHTRSQLRRGPSPENVHVLLTPVNDRWVDAFINDLGEAVEAARALPPSELAAQLREMFANLDPADVSDDVIAGMMSSAGVSQGALPGRTAEVNQMMNALPTAIIERALVHYVDGTFRPARG